MNVRPYFHMHDFPRPSQESLDGRPGTLAEHPGDFRDPVLRPTLSAHRLIYIASSLTSDHLSRVAS